MFIHYHPTFWRFHIHVTLINSNINIGCGFERCHLLDQVISNIESYSDYYQKTNLICNLIKNSEIYSQYI